MKNCDINKKFFKENAEWFVATSSMIQVKALPSEVRSRMSVFSGMVNHFVEPTSKETFSADGNLCVICSLSAIR